MTLDIYHAENERVLELVSFYLNFFPREINKEQIDKITMGQASGREQAFAALMAAVCGLDPYGDPSDKEMFRRYFIPMIKELSADRYKKNSYYENICIPNKSYGKWTLETKSYKPYEAFVYDDLEMRTDGRILPHIGYLTEELSFPCVSEGGREWMTVTPNEINTMEKPISRAFGNALTFGLGLGYYAYMVSEKKQVKSITVVERDQTVIELFQSLILPQFKNKEKVRIVCEDAFTFADRELNAGGYDHIFTDIWHDPSDGIELYLKMKEREKLSPNSVFEYWIEKTIKCYLGE